jgi:hypothetical protein
MLVDKLSQLLHCSAKHQSGIAQWLGFERPLRIGTLIYMLYNGQRLDLYVGGIMFKS